VAEDIADELRARGDSLSLRAARYIEIKRTTCRGLEASLRSMCQKSLEHESPEPQEPKP